MLCKTNLTKIVHGMGISKYTLEPGTFCCLLPASTKPVTGSLSTGVNSALAARTVFPTQLALVVCGCESGGHS
jgi:hypothetical protein